jgi:hypothetical protein
MIGSIQNDPVRKQKMLIHSASVYRLWAMEMDEWPLH